MVGEVCARKVPSLSVPPAQMAWRRKAKALVVPSAAPLRTLPSVNREPMQKKVRHENGPSKSGHWREWALGWQMRISIEGGWAHDATYCVSDSKLVDRNRNLSTPGEWWWWGEWVQCASVRQWQSHPS